MESVKNISLGIIHGFWDSIRGMTLLLYIDAEIHRLNALKETERQQRRLLRQGHIRRSPSPVPSSASAMEREMREREIAAQGLHNADERSLESIRRKPKQAEEDKPKGEKKIAKQVLKCCLLNGGFTWLSIILFEQLLLPALKFILTLCYGEHSEELHIVWRWLPSILSVVFGMMWVLPIFLLSKIVSSLWFADIANAAYRIRKGKPQMIPNISKLVADFLFSLVVQALFLVQSMLVNLIPVRYMGSSLCFIHLCLLYSLYSFEYKWFNMGWELHRRLSYIENNWPYFMGFGIPLTVLTNMTNSVIVSSCIFSIFFPLFILSGNEAKPLVGTTEIPLRLFSPVIFVSNLFFNRSGRRRRAPQPLPTDTEQPSKRVLPLTQEYLLKQQLQQQFMRPSETPMRSPLQPEQPQFRYQQPPPFNSAHSSRASSVDTRAPSERRYSSGLRPLIPTPVPGAPKAPVNGPTVHQR